MEVAEVQAQIAELVTMGKEAFDAGRPGDAEEIFRGLRAITKTNVEVNTQLGLLLATRGAYQEARAPLEDAALLDDSDPVVFNVLSACAFETGDYEAALVNADQALRLRRTYSEAHNNRGNALLRLGRPSEGLEAFKAALMLTPRDADVHVNLANVLNALERPAEALRSLDRALALAPRLATAHVNRGNVLQRVDRHVEALAAYDEAIALDSGSIDAHWNRGLCHLLIGDYAAGWQGYEWRWRRGVRETQPRGCVEPLWLGAEDLAGRTILLHGEQGLGDCIQFARYARQVADRGAIVILEVYATLAPLFEGLAGVSQLVRRGDPTPPFELHCPLMSLPLALGQPAPAPEPQPYLRADAGRLAAWTERLGPKAAPRIGLVASGSPTHGNDLQRSLSFETLAPHLPAGLEYHLLQKELRPADRDALAARPDVRVWAEAIHDFADTAALAQLMDRVVSVDTSVAHLAGAIGRPTSLLLPTEPDWRWGLNAASTPWYEGMQIYRQTRRGDWRDPLQKLAADLPAMTAA
ncbi:tetratricopeptide repeat protein [Phenylobacterium sp. LjRoot225]|uniref:tetratricopeptide repeat protein n=1 Tax=Phenylobacterium sp. LjRoot225 TaxID=3342285 RepID=UPI003ECF16A3